MMQGDCLTVIRVLLIFLPVVCSGQTGASQVFTRQSGTGAVLRSVESKLDEGPSVVDFGADPTGVADSSAAFARCHAAKTRCFVPEGAYKTLSLFQMTKTGFVMPCATRETTITYSGPPIAVAFQVGDGSSFAANNIIVSNCTFAAPNVTEAVLKDWVGDANVFDHIAFGNGIVGMKIQGSNQVVVRNATCFDGATHPSTCLLIDNAGTAIRILDPGFQSIAGATGLKIQNNSAGILVEGGTMEQLSLGADVDATSHNITFKGVDMEVNSSGESIRTAGSAINIEGDSTVIDGNIHVLGTAQATNITSATAARLIVDSGAKWTSVRDSNFSSAFALTPSPFWISDAGSYTTWQNITNNGASNGQTQPDWMGGIFNAVNVFTHLKGCAYCATATGGTLNNLVASYDLQGSDGAIAITGWAPQLFDGLQVRVRANQILTTGAACTLNFSGTGVKQIRGAHTTGSGVLASGYPANTWINLTYSADLDGWLDPSQ